jgi:acyl carrier protein
MVNRDALLDMLENELGIDTSAIADDTPLFSSGMVDSFALVTLMTEIERAEGFRIQPDEVTLDNLDSIAKIVAFVGRKRS